MGSNSWRALIKTISCFGFKLFFLSVCREEKASEERFRKEGLGDEAERRGQRPMDLQYEWAGQPWVGRKRRKEVRTVEIQERWPLQTPFTTYIRI